MKSFLVLLAGGVGSRMGAPLPKQFIDFHGAPIIAHTLANFQRNERVSEIVIVCHQDFIDLMKEIVEKHGISKVTSIVPGGETGHDSARNGVFSLKGKAEPGDLVIVHDAARPLVPQAIINDMLDVATEKGNACSSIPMNETIVVTDDQKSGTSEVDRSRVRRVQTPQTYRFDLISGLYERAEKDGRHDFVYANTMALHYGVRLFFSKGFGNNIKITKPEDMALLEALSQFDEEALAK